MVQKLTKETIATRNKDQEEGTGTSTGPTTTVFVGNISEKASDMLVRQLLAVSVGTLFTNFVCTIILNILDTFKWLVLSFSQPYFVPNP